MSITLRNGLFDTHIQFKPNDDCKYVDINQYHLNIAKNVIGLSPYVNYVFSDSIAYLRNFPSFSKINLLFLDSFDYHGDENNKRAAAEHQLKEFQACEKNLEDNSIVLLDDIFDINYSGKGALSIPYMLSKGWKIINFQDYNAQTIGIILLWLSAFLTLFTGYDYMRKGIDHAISEDNKD